MTKPTIPLDQFIRDNLNQPCGQMVDHLNANDKKLLFATAPYLEYQREYPILQIITLRIKLFEYYSCMRQFEYCNLLQAELCNLLKECDSKSLPGFESEELRAQYYMLQGIQSRNLKPVAKFDVSENYFQRSEQIYNCLMNKCHDKKTMQLLINEHFRVLMNLLGLYVNYDNQPAKAAALIERMEKSIEVTAITNHGYLSIYRYCLGSYYLSQNDNERAVAQFNLAFTEAKAAPEAIYSAADYFAVLNKKLEQATEALPKSQMAL